MWLLGCAAFGGLLAAPLVVITDVAEQVLREVALRDGGETQLGFGALDGRDLPDAVDQQPGQVLVISHPHPGLQVERPRHAVDELDLGKALEFGDQFADVGAADREEAAQAPGDRRGGSQPATPDRRGSREPRRDEHLVNNGRPAAPDPARNQSPG